MGKAKKSNKRPTTNGIITLNLELRRILVIAGSGIGNILLATPLIRSLKKKYPDSIVDVLVPEGRGAILDGNPDIHEVIEFVRHQGVAKAFAFFRRIWRRYDVAVSAQAGDRYLINAWLAAPLRCSHLRASDRRRLIHLAIQHRIPADDDTHAVIHGLRLLDPLGVERDYTLVPPQCPSLAKAQLEELLPFSRQQQPYVVLHPYPRNRYKCWTTAGWRAAAQFASERGFRVVLTGGAGQDEQACIQEILDSGCACEIVDLSGALSLQQVSDLLGGAALYVGPDTGVTHLAAACGTPCIALYGPTIPVYWGPWPQGYAKDVPPFSKQRGIQRCGNVAVVMTNDDCFACGREGCYNDPSRPSACMEGLSPDMVLSVMRSFFDGDDEAAGKKSCLLDR